MVIYGWSLNDIAQQKPLYGFFDAAGKYLHIGKASRAQKKPGFCLMNQPVGDPFFAKIAKVIRMARIFTPRCGFHFGTSHCCPSGRVAVLACHYSHRKNFYHFVPQENESIIRIMLVFCLQNYEDEDF
jgi:hypothetical protein